VPTDRKQKIAIATERNVVVPITNLEVDLSCLKPVTMSIFLGLSEIQDTDTGC